MSAPPVPAPRRRENTPSSPGLNSSPAAGPPLPARPRPGNRVSRPPPSEPAPPTPTTPRSIAAAPGVFKLPSIASTAAPPAPTTEGFGTCLQDTSCYDVINKRHEDELLALESLRAHLFNRSRIDKEYAEKLANANLKSSRKVANINQSSAIVKVSLCNRSLFCFVFML